MNALLKLVSRWREEADLLRGYGADGAATATEKHAREVIEAVKRAEDEALTLTEAAAESNYSKRRLRELVSTVPLPKHRIIATSAEKRTGVDELWRVILSEVAADVKGKPEIASEAELDESS